MRFAWLQTPFRFYLHNPGLRNYVAKRGLGLIKMLSSSNLSLGEFQVQNEVNENRSYLKVKMELLKLDEAPKSCKTGVTETPF